MEHITPVVTIEEVLNNIEKFNIWGIGSTPKDKYSERIEHMNIPIACNVCNNLLKQRKINHSYVYYCNHNGMKKDRNVSVSAQTVHERVLELIKNLIQNIDISTLEELSKKKLKSVVESSKKEIRELENVKKRMENQIISLLNSDNYRKLQDLITDYEKLEKEIKSLTLLQEKIITWIQNIKLIITKDFQDKIKLCLDDDVVTFGRMVIHSLHITNESISIYYYLSNAFNLEGEKAQNE